MKFKKGTNRNILLVILLMIVTLGLYYFYWVYQTSCEIKDFTGDEKLDPTKETLLNIIPFYSIFWFKKIGKIAYLQIPDMIEEKNVEDKTNMLIIFVLLNPIILILSISLVFSVGLIIFPTIPTLILQDRLNNIWNKIDDENDINQNYVIPINRLIFLYIITLGIYNLYWIYCTVKNIREFTKVNRLSPALEVILNIFIPFYHVFWVYRYSRIIYNDIDSKAYMDNLEDNTIFLTIINLVSSVLVTIISIAFIYAAPPIIIIISIVINVITVTHLQKKLNSIFSKKYIEA